MSSSAEDAPIGLVPAERIPQLALLYDRFANALDPFAPERDQAEMLFEQEVVQYYDALPSPKPDLSTFRKGLILRCRRHLRATDKPSSL
jgi:tRNA U34 5-methylaminomethyl-2-thiouridine-forming methyltransferase MnmC